MNDVSIKIKNLLHAIENNDAPPPYAEDLLNFLGYRPKGIRGRMALFLKEKLKEYERN